MIGWQACGVLQAHKKKKPASMKIILKRFVNTASVSWMLTYQSALYIGTVKICGSLGVDKFLRYFQTDFEKIASWMTGGRVATPVAAPTCIRSSENATGPQAPGRAGWGIRLQC